MCLDALPIRSTTDGSIAAANPGKKPMRTQFSIAVRRALHYPHFRVSCHMCVTFSWSAGRRGAAGRQLIASRPISGFPTYVCLPIFIQRGLAVLYLSHWVLWISFTSCASLWPALRPGRLRRCTTPRVFTKNGTSFPQEQARLGPWRTDQGDDLPEGPTRIARHSCEGENPGSRIGNGFVAHGYLDGISFRRGAVRVIRPDLSSDETIL